jgi:2-iminobutanoate/2-iminopropanoate deaminase
MVPYMSKLKVYSAEFNFRHWAFGIITLANYHIITLTYLWPMQKNIINTTQAPAPIGPYSQAVQAGNLLFISGQVPINPATGTIEAKDVTGETEQVMKNLNAVLTEAGYDFSHVVKTTIFLTDMSLFNAVNEVYGKYFSGNFPARETVAVKGLPRNVNVEISMIAAK